MGGRGTYAIGNNVAYLYKTVGKLEGVKVLKGIAGKHKLPEEAHSSSAYIRLNPDGSFHELRIYGKDKYLKFEIAYHKENSLGKGKILHYHIYDKDFNRSKAIRLHKNTVLYKKYSKFFKGVKYD